MSAEPRRERKVITVVFADLVGFTARSEQLDPEDVEAILQPYQDLLRTELERYGGTVEKFIGDAVMAIFGAPVAHEDDPERAVRAALAVRDTIRERGELQLRIAVNTGEAIVRLGARPESGEGMATGDVLNTASRLQNAAPVNGILVGETTYNATKHVISYGAPQQVEAKGKVEPVAAREALEARSRFGVDVRQTSAVPLVGRERERGLLVDTLARAESERSPQLVTLVGVPGIGKSRLVYELFRELEQRSDEIRYWRQGRSLPYGEGVSFWALSEMVKAQAGILDGDEPAAAVDKLEGAVREVIDEDEADWVVARLGPLVGVAADAEVGGERRNESFTAWRRFLEGLAEARPLVLVFEDLHWADDGLLDFVDHLADWASGVPILILCTTRPELLERRPGWGGGKLNALTLGLAPLSGEESARLLALVLEQAVLPASTQQALLERASGNPLYAEQFARLYLERGTVDDLPLPESVHGLIAARLDALSPEEKSLLQDAAVMGKVFWSGAVRTDDDRLHALERKEFIRRERRSSVAGEEEFTFRHVLVRDVAYGQIPRADRSAKHLRAAEWIEGLGRPHDHAELIAHHYTSAIDLSPSVGNDVKAKARKALREAGDRAFALNVFASAIDFYRSALELSPELDPDRPQLLFRLGRAQYQATDEGAETLEEAVTALVAAGDRETAAEAETLLTTHAWGRGDHDRTWQHLERATELVADSPPSPAKAIVLATRARRLTLAGRHDEALKAAKEALALSESLGLEENRSHVLNSLGLARRGANDGDGYAELRESIAVANAINSIEAARGYNNLASILDIDGRLQEAEEAERESKRLAERFGLAGALRWARAGDAFRAYENGEWDEALRFADEFIAEVEAGSPHYLEAITRALRAIMWIARGDVAGALDEGSRALTPGRLAKDPQSLYPALALNAYLSVEAGAIAAARALFDEFFALRHEGREIEFRAPAQPIWAGIQTGYADEFTRIIEASRRTPWAEAAEAMIAEEWIDAADIYERIGARAVEAFTRLRGAEYLASKGRRAEADRELARALGFYRSVGATRFLQQGEALLAASA
jgi:class 3 adenylate cyclase/tetratricopeptide (TPR) repeat protein